MEIALHFLLVTTGKSQAMFGKYSPGISGKKKKKRNKILQYVK